MKKFLIILILLGIATTTHAANFIDSGLVGYWTFDRRDFISSTISFRDRGSGNDPAFPLFGTTYRVGKQGQGLVFDNLDDYVDIVSFNALNGTTAMTICAWNYIYNLGVTSDFADGTIFTRDVGAADDSLILFWYNINGVGSGDKTYSFNVGNGSTAGNRINGIVKPRAKTWNHVCGVMNGTKRALYVNGRLDSEHTLGSLTTYTSVSLDAIIGASPTISANMYFDGIIDDVRVYNRELSAREIKNLYNYGLSKHN